MGFFRTAAIVSLLFLALSAIVGAIPMLIDPHGQPWKMPQSLLARSPFHSYLVPGLILLVMNGVMSLIVLWLMQRGVHGFGLWIAAQGCVLLGWLIVECILIRMVIWPHYLYGAVALLLVVSGAVLQNLAGDAARTLPPTS